MDVWSVIGCNKGGDETPFRFMVILPLFELYETGWVVGDVKVNPAATNAALSAVTNSVGA